jgi:hypothetical protein
LGKNNKGARKGNIREKEEARKREEIGGRGRRGKSKRSHTSKEQNLLIHQLCLL